MAFSGRKPSSTARGLGREHQKARAALALPCGDPCPYCREPMWPGQELDADHEQPRAFGGDHRSLRWAHRSCNRRAGAALGGRVRRRVRRLRWEDRWS